MNALKARVRNGRLILDEPTSLPEGAEVPLVFANDEDEMTPDELAEHEEAIAEGLADMRAGRTVDGEEFFARLRAR
jgi:hypothetical protein